MRRPIALLLATLMLMVGVAVPAAAVGTGDVYTTSDTICDATHPCRAPIEWRTSVYGPVSGTSIPRRTMFTVYAQAGEQILLGSSSVGWDAADAVVWNPGQITDTMVSAVPAIDHGVNGFSCRAQRTANPGVADLGQIRTRSQELAGARSATGTGNPTGYVPCVYTAPVTGLYRVGFYGTAGGASDAEAGAMLPIDPTSSGNPTGLFPMFVTPTPTGTIRTSTSVAAWDVTVRPAATTSTTDLEGRVFTMAYAAFAGDNPRAVTMQYYLTTLDGFRYHVDTKGFDPNGFVVYGNQVGFLDADGSPLNRDVLGNGTRPQALETIVGGAQLAHPIYPLSFEPLAAETLAALSVPVAPATPSVSDLSFNGSKQGQTAYVSQGGTFTFTTSAPGTVQVVISPSGNTDPGLPTNRSLRTVVNTGGEHTIVWDGLDNSRDPVPVGANYRVGVELRVGEYHAPMLDVESSVNGGPSITLENPPGLLCPFTGATSTGTNCTTAFYDDRGYTTSNNVDVGTPGGALCPSFTGTVPTIRSTGITGFDSTSTQRAFGSSSKFNANPLCPATGGTLGDAKGLDLWTYFPSNEATTLVDIVGIPAAPTAVDDTATTPASTPLQVVAPGVLGNDTGTDLTVTSVTAASHGTVVRSADGSYLYTPTTGYSGPDQFTYTISDSADQTATATVRITVTPAAVDDTGSTAVDTALVSPTSVLANDVGSSLVASLVTSPSHGVLVLNGNGTYTYTPAAGFSGADEFTYRASDGTSSVVRTVRLTVTPLAADDSSTTAVDTALTVPAATGVLANDAGTLTVSGNTQPGHGAVTVAADGAYTYTPAAGFSGVDTFTYTATDGTTPLTRTVTITVTPTAADDSGTTPVDTALVGDSVLDNDAGSLTVSANTQPGHGTVSVDPDGSYTYTPDAGFSGVDAFTYTATDGTTSLTRTVAITVTPTAADDSGTTRRRHRAGGRQRARQRRGLPDRGPRPRSRPHGTVSVDPDGSYTYTPDAGFSGTDSFTYTVDRRHDDADPHGDHHGHADRRGRRGHHPRRHGPRGQRAARQRRGLPDRDREHPAGQRLGRGRPRRVVHLHAGRRVLRGRHLHLHGHGRHDLGHPDRDDHRDADRGERLGRHDGRRPGHGPGGLRSAAQRRRVPDGRLGHPAGERLGRGGAERVVHLHARRRVLRHGRLHLHGHGRHDVPDPHGHGVRHAHRGRRHGDHPGRHRAHGRRR